LTPGQLFTDEDFCSIAMSEFLLLHADEEWKDIRDFHCNNGFIVAFKKRNAFSSRGAHDKRQLKVDAGHCTRWMEMAKALLDQLDHTRIVKADRTMWCLDSPGLMVWAKRRSDNHAENMKLLLYVLVHGKTTGVERSQINGVAPHRADHSKAVG
jgi:hypothetical protein